MEGTDPQRGGEGPRCNSLLRSPIAAEYHELARCPTGSSSRRSTVADVCHGKLVVGFREATAAAMRVSQGQLCNVLCVGASELSGRQRNSTLEIVSSDNHRTTTADLQVPNGIPCRFLSQVHHTRHTSSLFCP